MKLLLFADLHLDTAFAWAPAHAARLRRQNLRTALTRILELADSIRADALLCAGDLYEQDRFTPDTAAFLQRALSDAGRPVFIAPGNHDWYGPTSLYAEVEWPSHVTVFRTDRLEPVDLDEGLTLWGAAHRAPANTDGFLASGFRADRGGVNLALFHGSEESAMPWQPEGKRPHAPFTADQVEAAGLDHAFCGHFHTRRDAPRHTYPGSPDPLVFGTHFDGGAVEIDVGPDGRVERNWHDVAVSEMHDLALDISGAASMQEVRDAVAGAVADLTGFARLTLTGEVASSLELDLAGLEREPGGLEAVRVRAPDLTYAYDIDRLADEPSVRGRFIRDVREADDLSDHDRRRILVTGLRALDGRRDLEVP